MMSWITTANNNEVYTAWWTHIDGHEQNSYVYKVLCRGSAAWTNSIMHWLYLNLN